MLLFPFYNGALFNFVRSALINDAEMLRIFGNRGADQFYGTFNLLYRFWYIRAFQLDIVRCSHCVIEEQIISPLGSSTRRKDLAIYFELPHLVPIGISANMGTPLFGRSKCDMCSRSMRLTSIYIDTSHGVPLRSSPPAPDHQAVQ